MKNLLILCLLSSIAVQVRPQAAGENCQTPDHRNGICVSMQSCDSLRRLITPTVIFPEVRDFLLKSRCGNLENYVCCPEEEGTTQRSTTTTRRSTPTTRRSAPTTRRSTPTTRRSTPTTRRSIPTTEKFTTTTQTPVFLSPTNTISARKCTEYADFAYNKTYTLNVHSNEPRVTRTSNCALTYTGLVIGGEDAKLREFPHMALIGFTYDNATYWDCGGTLISERFVLSARHCDSVERPAKFVRLGEHDLNSTDDTNRSDFNIIQKFSRNNTIRGTYSDIILFMLDRNVDFNYAIRPACLPDELSVPKYVIASGWGRVKFSGNRSSILQKVELETFLKSQWSATDIGQRYRKLENSIIFAGHNSKGADTCQGDSGGPLQFLHEKHFCTYVVAGVTSIGKPCGSIGTPAVYTRVYSHLSWIEEIVWPKQ